MRRLLITTLVLFALAGGSALAQSFSTLEERMTYAEFKAAGLDKLTPEELKALNEFLAGKVVPAAAAATQVQDERGFEGRSRPDGAIVSRISGEFTGWEGRGTRFTLDNGQVWEVVDGTSRLKVSVENPAVVITPGVLNSWYFRIDGYNTRAKVKRIR